MSESKKRRKLSNGSYEAVQVPDSQNGNAVPKSESKDTRRSLFVRSLPSSVTTERLAEHFSQNYPLKHATVVLDPQTKISRGFGFVTFADREDAIAAVTELNNSVIDGRKIKVEVAEARHREISDETSKKAVNLKAAKLKSEREKQRAETQPPKLIVRNLPWSIKEADDLALLFRSYGKVKWANVPKRNAQEQAGFGFVVLRGRKNAEKALDGVNGKVVDGRTLAVDWAVDKETWEKAKTGEVDAETGRAQHLTGENVEAIEENEQDPVDPNPALILDPETGPEDEEQTSDADAGVGLDEISQDASDAGSISSHEADEQIPKRDTSDQTTIFIRNLPFTTDDDNLKAHFNAFGPVRYARVVFDHETDRSRGTAFVCFFNESDARSCVKGAPKHDSATSNSNFRKDSSGPSILQNEASDPTGQYTLEGRVLQISRALPKEEADTRAQQASTKRRETHDRDRRRLYLLSEGTIPKGSKLYEKLGKAELDIREASAKQRQKLIKTNPNLGVSLTRLSVRNVPRTIDNRELKALAREAVVGFATDVKNGSRQALSKEELSRGGDGMKEAEHRRKEKGKGIVKQAKIVYEGREGGKVKAGKEGEGGRSRGYGFIEYTSHRSALMGLRWLNGHVVTGGGDKPKRLIVEFAIENAQVVQRRGEKERRMNMANERKGKQAAGDSESKPDAPSTGKAGNKRKRAESGRDLEAAGSQPQSTVEPEEKNKIAKRNRIIAKKRHARKARSGAK